MSCYDFEREKNTTKNGDAKSKGSRVRYINLALSKVDLISKIKHEQQTDKIIQEAITTLISRGSNSSPGSRESYNYKMMSGPG